MLVVLLSLWEAVMSFLLVRKWKFWTWFKLKKIIYGDCQVVWKEWILHSFSDEEQRKICANFCVAPQTAKVTAIAHDKKDVEKALNFWVEKHDFYCLCSALIKKHDFYCSVILETVHDTVQYRYCIFHCSIISWGLG